MFRRTLPALPAALTLAVLAVPSMLGAQIIQWPQTGHQYELVRATDCNGAVTWDQARALAASRQVTVPGGSVRGHLATITSQAEFAFLAASFPSSDAFIGGYQPAGSPEPGGNWRWITAEPWSFAPWRGGEPNNNYRGGHCGSEQIGQVENILQAERSWTSWNDVPQTPLFAMRDYLIEYPTTTNAREIGVPVSTCVGAARLLVNGPPRIGTPGFAAFVGNLPASIPGVLVVGNRIDPPVPVLGVQLHVSPMVAVPVMSDSSGQFVAPLPIPNDRSWNNAKVALQSFWLDQRAPPPCPPLGVASTNAVELTFH